VLTHTQLYEDDARIGHREFDLKLTQRVKMSMVGFVAPFPFGPLIHDLLGRRT
jgi:hypothetical protein